jgi:hypothetical protein
MKAWMESNCRGEEREPVEGRNSRNSERCKKESEGGIAKNGEKKR